MAEPRRLRRAVSELIAQQIGREGIDVDSDDLDVLLERATEGYEAVKDLSSRDTMPTTAELRDGAADIGALLNEVVRRLIDDPYLGTWLGHYLSEQAEVEAVDAYKAFLDPLKQLLDAADAAEDAFAGGEPMTVTYADGTEKIHQRRTRVDARDHALIPAIVEALRAVGLQLRDEQVGAWDHDAIAVVCNAVELVLDEMGISAPARGDTAASLGGDANEGRLVKAVKRAWTNSRDTVAR